MATLHDTLHLNINGIFAPTLLERQGGGDDAKCQKLEQIQLHSEDKRIDRQQGKISIWLCETRPSLSFLPCQGLVALSLSPQSIKTTVSHMVIQTSYSGTGGVQAVASRHEEYMHCDWRLCCKPQDADARSDTSARTMDEAVDLEVLAYMAATEDFGYDECCDASSNVSGLPLVCSNCGVSFFSLQIPDDQVDCYCSGECKWSVIMYREMDMRMYAMRRSTHLHTTLGSTCSSSSLYGDSGDEETEEGGLVSLSFSDDSTASSLCG